MGQESGLLFKEVSRAKFTFGEDKAANNFNAFLRNFQVRATNEPLEEEKEEEQT